MTWEEVSATTIRQDHLQIVEEMEQAAGVLETDADVDAMAKEREEEQKEEEEEHEKEQEMENVENVEHVENEENEDTEKNEENGGNEASEESEESEEKNLKDENGEREENKEKEWEEAENRKAKAEKKEDGGQKEEAEDDEEEKALEEDVAWDLGELPRWMRNIIERMFTFYSGADSTNPGSGLGLTKFRGFLRDAGVLSNCRGESPRHRHRNASPAHNGEWRGASSSLPLKQVLLTLVQADLVYVQARDAQSGTKHSHMTLDGFFGAIAELARLWLLQDRERLGPNGLLRFCEAVIVPLARRLGLGEEALLLAQSVLSSKKVSRLFHQSSRGLETIFVKYAHGIGSPEPYRCGHWTSQSMRRFAHDVDLLGEISHSVMQRLLDACTQDDLDHDRGSRDMLSFAGFHLWLVMVAQRTNSWPAATPQRRVCLLLVRLSAIKGGSDLAISARSVLNVLSRGQKPSRVRSQGAGACTPRRTWL
mmetsp:Transcript_61666/g.122009  ORF Transcript_61666/g.122009 Transcript_61666/m.122009 type:complete len:480 (-) Transcript_61666:17-1456(-)